MVNTTPIPYLPQLMATLVSFRISLVTWSYSGPLDRIWLRRSLDEHSIARGQGVI